MCAAVREDEGRARLVCETSKGRGLCERVATWICASVFEAQCGERVCGAATRVARGFVRAVVRRGWSRVLLCDETRRVFS